MTILHSIKVGADLGSVIGASIATLTDRSPEKGACWGILAGAALGLLVGVAVENREREFH